LYRVDLSQLFEPMHSLRDGFTFSFALSPVTGLFCHRRLADHSEKLDASVGASGPHDFAVRVAHARLPRASRPPHLTATFVTIATRPSYRVRRGELIALICPTG